MQSLGEGWQNSLKKSLREVEFGQITPGGIIGIATAGSPEENFLVHCFGKDRQGGDGRPVTHQLVYDLASLTKPLVTALCCMLLVESKQFTLKTRICEIMKEKAWGAGWRSVTVGQLLSHGSGLVAHKPYYVEALGRRKSSRTGFIKERIIREQIPEQNRVHLYSDLGFMLLGLLVEESSGQHLDKFFYGELARPLGLEDDLFFPASKFFIKQQVRYAPTRICPWTHRLLEGEVDDDNCRVMGGVAGHAGLFGTIRGVVLLGKILAELFSGLRSIPQISGETVREWSQNRAGTTWAIGFDTPSATGSSSGRYFDKQSIGHLGYTGTSIWIDLTRGIVVALLTNRVNIGLNRERIMGLRQMVHNRVMKELLENSNAT